MAWWCEHVGDRLTWSFCAAPCPDKFKLNKADGGLFIWFVCSGLIHLILEGYFGYNNLTLQSDMSFLGQLCTSTDLSTHLSHPRSTNDTPTEHQQGKSTALPTRGTWAQTPSS